MKGRCRGGGYAVVVGCGQKNRLRRNSSLLRRLYQKQESKVGASSQHWRSEVRATGDPYTNEISCGFPFPRLPRVSRL